MTNEVQPNRLVTAPTNAGKGTGGVIPNLADWNGPAVIFDPKPTLPDQGEHRFDPEREGRPVWTEGHPEKEDNQ
jgi:type IV secretory pathway TraG/TraD family ATPase VirD4